MIVLDWGFWAIFRPSRRHGVCASLTHSALADDEDDEGDEGVVNWSEGLALHFCLHRRRHLNLRRCLAMYYCMPAKYSCLPGKISHTKPFSASLISCIHLAWLQVLFCNWNSTFSDTKQVKASLESGRKYGVSTSKGRQCAPTICCCISISIVQLCLQH